MKKILTSLVLSLMFLFPANLAMAASNTLNDVAVQEMAIEVQQPVTFQSNVTVGKDGGRFQIGFVNIEFKKDFMDASLLPATFDAEIYAEKGQVFIEFQPGTPVFYKQVHLRIDSYSGYIYDRAVGKNIYVNIKKHQILAPHFSRYCMC